MFFQCCWHCKWQLTSGGTKRSLCINLSLGTCEQCQHLGHKNPKFLQVAGEFLAILTSPGLSSLPHHEHSPLYPFSEGGRVMITFLFWKKQYKLCCSISVLVVNNLFWSISRSRLREERRSLGVWDVKQPQNKAVLPGPDRRTIKPQFLNPQHSWNFTWISEYKSIIPSVMQYCIPPTPPKKKIYIAFNF